MYFLGKLIEQHIVILANSVDRIAAKSASQYNTRKVA